MQKRERITVLGFGNNLLALLLVFVLAVSLFAPAQVITAETVKSATGYAAMLERAEALVNYEWVPSERIYTWNGNSYNGKTYFEAGETVKGVPYTLFSWEFGFDGLLSLEQYKTKASSNYSTTAYCSSVGANRTGPVYGNCCATFVSEVFGGSFMSGSNPRYDGVGTVNSAPYSTTYKNVKASAIQPGDALSCTSGAHIVWVSEVTDTTITIYESTPPVCQKVMLSKSSNLDSNGYLVYGGNTYNIVAKSNEILRDDLSAVATLSSDFGAAIRAYTISSENTPVYDAMNEETKVCSIYSTDLCLIDAVFENGWCHVNVPLDAGGMAHGYVKTSVFFDDSSITTKTLNANMTAYNRSDLSSSFGTVPAGKEIFVTDENDTALQIVYPSSVGGFEAGWVSKADIDASADAHPLNTCLPLKAYPCAEADFEVYASDHTTRQGEIWTTDFCTINAIYADGWCEVTFPVSSGTKIGWTPLSNFVYDINYTPTPYVTSSEVTVYGYKDASTDINWHTGVGDTIFILGKYSDVYQICYPIDEAYGGGYKLGWIKGSDIDFSEEIEISFGDVNNDGKVNTLDRVALHRYLAFGDDYKPEILAAADLNDDTFINAADALILARHIAKWRGYETLPYIK